MNKKVLLLIAGATVFTLGIGTITFSGLNQVENLRINATETRAISFDKRIEGRYSAFDEDNHTMTIEGQLQDGNSVYMRAYNVTTVSADGYYADIDTSIIFYSNQDCTNEYTFQDLRSFTFAHEANDSDIIFDATLYDGFNYSYLNNQTFNKNNATVSSFDVDFIRRLSVHFTSSNAIDIHSLTLTYVCSYDYVEPTLKTVEIYASNDFHGAIEQDSKNPGLEYYGSYFKLKGQQPNTLLLDQGDTWQGSIYSNTNSGNLINDVMCEARWDARTIGNHDFDWGVDPVIENTARSYGGYRVPALAANIYDFNFGTKQFGTTQQSNIGQEYVTYTLENGLKVGVIGVIGAEQITSINTQFTYNIGFKEHTPIIKSLATKLRTVENCDLVICSIHADEDDVKNEGLQGYVDLVLCAHSHQHEINVYNGLTFAQFSKEGREAGHITLTYNTGTKKVVTSVETIYKQNIINYVESTGGVDETIHSLVESAKQACDSKYQPETPLATEVVNFPQGNEDVKYLLNTIDTKYYKYVGDEWVKQGRVANPATDNIYYWSTEQEKTDGLDSLVEGAYYIDLTTANYYHCVGGALTDENSFIEGNDAETTDFFASNFPISWGTKEELPNLMAEAIVHEAIAEGFDDIDLAYVNDARVALESDSWRFADVYRAFPFDNKVYIIEATADEIYQEIIKWNYACFAPGFNREFDRTRTYKIACLDYLAFHNNYPEREYDYFPGIASQEPESLSKNYRDILKDYLVSEGYSTGRVLNQRDYDKEENVKFSKDFIFVNNPVATFMYNYDGAPNEGVYTASPIKYREVIANHLPANPTREGYLFAGWYRNAACTQPLGSWYITNDMNVYAKWVDGYSTGQVDYLQFLSDENLTSTTVNATSGSGDNISVTFTHSEVANNSKYYEFGITNSGYITMTAPTGYTVLSLEMKTYGTYDNLKFYRGTNASGDLLTKVKDSSSGNTIYNVDVNGSSFYIKSSYNGNVWIFYISVLLVQNS